jgi:hypothetical protein
VVTSPSHSPVDALPKNPKRSNDGPADSPARPSTSGNSLADAPPDPGGRRGDMCFARAGAVQEPLAPRTRSTLWP